MSIKVRHGLAEHAAPAISPRAGRLFRKYALIFVLLVTGGVLTSGAVDIVVTYQESLSASMRLQREKATAAGDKIEQFVREIEHQLAWTLPPPWTRDTVTLDQRRDDLLRLLRRAPAITQISYLDGAGREQVRVSRLALNTIASGADYSGEPRFREARAHGTYFGPVFFRNGSEPYMVIALAEEGTDGGVSAAEVNLKFVWDVISRITVGRTGYAFAVDADGALVAHPNLTLVLQQSDVSGMPQVVASRAGTLGQAPAAMVTRSFQGVEVLSAVEPIEALGWLVFVEQPTAEAFEPLYAAVLRTAGLMVLGLVLSVTAGLALARAMVRPIHALQVGAARIGAGEWDQRLEVRTGDELEALGDAFNRMAAQLRESYAELERKVAERTRQLAEATLEAQAARSAADAGSEAKSAFLASMSHELRTPLNGIIGFSEVLLDPDMPVDAEMRAQFLENILQSGQHLLRLINDILDLSKVEAGKMELHPEAFDLAEALAGVHAVARALADKKQQRLTLNAPAEPVRLHHDPGRFKQVLFNLLSNAVKFTPDGGSITTTASVDGDWLEVAVADTGIGIAPEDQAKVFEEFQQIDTGYGRTQQGTGLGLALVREFVRLMGGDITLRSARGHGSVFTVRLPRQSCRPLASSSVEGSGEPVLVVEDDAQAGDSLALYLEQAGYAVTRATTAAEALDCAHERPPAAITLDLHLPDADDGWELLRTFKRDPVVGSVPIVVISNLDERCRSLELGASAHLVKPVTPATLVATLRQLTDPIGDLTAAPLVTSTAVETQPPS